MDAIDHLLKAALKAFKLDSINPEEIKQTVETAKVLIPKIAQAFGDIDKRLAAIENRLAAIERVQIKILETPVESGRSISEFRPNGMEVTNDGRR